MNNYRPWKDNTEVLDIISNEDLPKTRAKYVDNISNFKDLFPVLTKTAYWNKVDSLSAPQVGIDARLLVYRSVDGNWKEMFNPTVVFKQGEVSLRYEKCASHPGTHRKKSRLNRVTIQYWDEYGKVRVKTFNNIDASLILHEMDHLDGIDWSSTIEADKEE